MNGSTGGFMDVLTEEVVEGSIDDGARLAIDVRATTGGATLFLRGELDVAETEHLYQRARRAIDGSTAVITLDLAQLTFCDGSGLGCLVRIGNYAERAGCRMMLASPKPIVAKVLRIGQLDRRFAIVPASDLVSSGELRQGVVTG